MKKTVIVNISGIIFHIDEDAYERLNIYLDTLKRYFHNTSEDKEIIEDIEARIAELMQPRIHDNKQSISIEDIEEIITILGNPEDIAGETEVPGDAKSKATYTNTDNSKGTRRLYRDIDNAIIGGVCSGLAAYFRIDPVLFRILFLALIFAGGISLIIYPILWIAVPAANTAAQKLEMHGRNVNISNIERQIRDEYTRVKDKFSTIDTRSYGGKINNFFHELFRAFGRFIIAIASVLKYLFAVAMILFAIVMIVSLIAGFYFGNFALDEPLIGSFKSVHELLATIVDSFTANIFIILALVIVLLPCAALIYWGLKIMIRFNARDKFVSAALSIIWLGAVITFLGVLFSQFRSFRYESTANETVQLQKPSKNKLYINAIGLANDYNEYSHNVHESGLFGIDNSTERGQIISPITIYLEKAKGSVPYMEIVRMGRGSSYEDASQSLKFVSVYTSQADTTLSIDPFFRLRSGERWKFNRTHLILYIPEGMNIKFSKKIEPFIDDIRDQYYHYRDLSSEEWEMTSSGISINQQKIIEGRSLNKIDNKTLVIKLNEKYPLSDSELTQREDLTHSVTYKRWGHTYTVTYNDRNYKMNTISINGHKYKYGVVKFKIEKSTSKDLRLETIKTISGVTFDEASRYAKKIDFDCIQSDSTLMVDPIYLLDKDTKDKKQSITVKLYIPEQTKVYIDNSMKPLYNNDYDLGKQLEMNENGNLYTVY